MAISIFKVLKGLLIQQDSTLTPTAIQITPGGTANTTTTIQGSQTVARILTLPDATDTIVGKATTDALTNKTLGSTNTATGIKMASFTPDGIVTVTMPVATDTLVGKSTTDTLANKTLSSPTINNPTLSGSGGTLTLPAGPDTIVGRATTDTLTNKTLTTPTINNPTLSGSGGALTLPAGPDTLVGRATTDTLTNKTLTNPKITNSSASNTETLQVPNAAKATLDGLTRVAGNIMYGTDTQSLYVDNGSQLLSTGGISAWQSSYTYAVGNMVSFSNSIFVCITANTSSSIFETDQAKWALVNQPQVARNLLNVDNSIENGTVGAIQPATVSSYTSGTTPVGAFNLGSGGSIGLSAQTTGALTGKYSLQLTTASTFNVGQGFVSAVIPVDPASQTKVHSISFDYAVTAGASNMNFSGTSANTFHVYIYDATNSAYIQPIGVYGMSYLSGRYTGQFQMPSNTTSCYLFIMVGNASTTGTSTLLFDNFFVGQIASNGYTAPVAYAQAYHSVTGSNYWGTTSTSFADPTISGGTISLTSRVSSGLTLTSAAGNVAGVTFTPASASAVYQVTAYFVADTISSSNPMGVQLVSGATVLGVLPGSVAASSRLTVPTTITGIFVPGSTSAQTVKLQLSSQSGSQVAINGYADSGYSGSYIEWTITRIDAAAQPISQYDGRVVAAEAQGTPSGGNTSAIIFPTKMFDTSGSYNLATGIFTAPVSGTYSITGAIYANGANVNYYAFLNGSNYCAIGAANGFGTTIGGLIKMSAGDTMFITSNVGMGTTYSSSTFGISLLSGAQQIVAGQKIEASYYCSTNQSASTSTPFNFDTKEYDTTGAVTTGASWRFTAPTAGTYLVSGAGASTSGFQYIMLYKNGAAYKTVGSVNTSAGPTGEFGGMVQLNAGDYIEFRPSGAVTAQGGTLATAGVLNVAIKQVN